MKTSVGYGTRYDSTGLKLIVKCFWVVKCRLLVIVASFSSDYERISINRVTRRVINACEN